MEGTFWAFVPAIVAIVMALITKQVYISLFIGIFIGAIFYANGNPLQAIGYIYIVMSEKIGSNVSILAFLIILGIIVILLQKSGGSYAYGELAKRKIKSRTGAISATAALGCLIFVDDYFNCLTVGSVMRPVTNKFKVSHAKLAWIIDSTAAPICIIAPISSWAAAVSGELDGNGLIVFLKTIPFNFYALLTIAMVFIFTIFKIDFGKMKKDETIALETGNLDGGNIEDNSYIDETKKTNAKVIDLIIPVVILIICCVLGMIYTGYCLDYETGLLGAPVQSSNIIEAFSNCDAGLSLAIGSTIALLLIITYYLIRKSLNFNAIMESIPEGFKTMVSAILILVFAWTLSGIMGAKGGYLDAQAFVKNTLSGINLGWLFPACFFLFACLIAFATGTSWGTFGILIPIAIAILGSNVTTLSLLTVSATLGGAVFGDHVSPISDTTILSSAGATSNHVNHIQTQMPYAILIATITFIIYLIGGLISNLDTTTCAIILLLMAAIIFTIITLIIKIISRKKSNNY